MESDKNKINLTFSATNRNTLEKKVFSVQLVYKTSVQKIELNQNEFPMKHTQVKTAIQPHYHHGEKVC